MARWTHRSHCWAKRLSLSSWQRLDGWAGAVQHVLFSSSCTGCHSMQRLSRSDAKGAERLPAAAASPEKPLFMKAQHLCACAAAPAPGPAAWPWVWPLDQEQCICRTISPQLLGRPRSCGTAMFDQLNAADHPAAACGDLLHKAHSSSRILPRMGRSACTGFVSILVMLHKLPAERQSSCVPWVINSQRMMPKLIAGQESAWLPPHKAISCHVRLTSRCQLWWSQICPV